MKHTISLSVPNPDQRITFLSAILSDEITLYAKTRRFHWNVSGESFMELHSLFQKQYTGLEDTIDLVTERMDELGEPLTDAMNRCSELSRIQDTTGEYPPQKEMIHELLEDHESVIMGLREKVEIFVKENREESTSRFLTELITQHTDTTDILKHYLN